MDTADLAAWGVDAATVPAAPPEPALVVWPRNREAVAVFVSCATQWRWLAGMAGAARLGLDYPALEAAMRLCGVPRSRRADCFARVQVLERETLAIDAQQKKRRR